MSAVRTESDESSIFDWKPNQEQLLRHHAKVGQTLCDGRQSGKEIGFDIALKLSDGTVGLVHSEVARTHSEYFRHVLICCRVPLVVDVSCFDANAVRQVIDFLYSGTITLSIRQLPQLLIVAQAFQIPSLRRLLENFLAQKSSERPLLFHCLNIACSQYADISLRTKQIVLQEAIKNFQYFLTSEQFTELDIGAFETLMARDDLPVGKEIDIFYIVVHYYFNSLEYNDPNRVLQLVRYDHISVDEKLEMARFSYYSDDASFSAALEQLLADSFWRTTMIDKSPHSIDRRPKRANGSNFRSVIREINKRRNVARTRVPGLRRSGRYSIRSEDGLADDLIFAAKVLPGSGMVARATKDGGILHDIITDVGKTDPTNPYARKSKWIYKAFIARPKHGSANKAKATVLSSKDATTTKTLGTGTRKPHQQSEPPVIVVPKNLGPSEDANKEPNSLISEMNGMRPFTQESLTELNLLPSFSSITVGSHPTSGVSTAISFPMTQPGNVVCKDKEWLKLNQLKIQQQQRNKDQSQAVRERERALEEQKMAVQNLQQIVARNQKTPHQAHTMQQQRQNEQLPKLPTNAHMAVAVPKPQQQLKQVEHIGTLVPPIHQTMHSQQLLPNSSLPAPTQPQASLASVHQLNKEQNLVQMLQKAISMTRQQQQQPAPPSQQQVSFTTQQLQQLPPAQVHIRPGQPQQQQQMSVPILLPMPQHAVHQSQHEPNRAHMLKLALAMTQQNQHRSLQHQQPGKSTEPPIQTIVQSQQRQHHLASSLPVQNWSNMPHQAVHQPQQLVNGAEMLQKAIAMMRQQQQPVPPSHQPATFIKQQEQPRQLAPTQNKLSPMQLMVRSWQQGQPLASSVPRPNLSPQAVHQPQQDASQQASQQQNGPYMLQLALAMTRQQQQHALPDYQQPTSIEQQRQQHHQIANQPVRATFPPAPQKMSLQQQRQLPAPSLSGPVRSHTPQQALYQLQEGPSRQRQQPRHQATMSQQTAVMTGQNRKPVPPQPQYVKVNAPQQNRASQQQQQTTQLPRSVQMVVPFAHPKLLPQQLSVCPTPAFDQPYAQQQNLQQVKHEAPQQSEQQRSRVSLLQQALMMTRQQQQPTAPILQRRTFFGMQNHPPQLLVDEQLPSIQAQTRFIQPVVQPQPQQQQQSQQRFVRSPLQRQVMSEQKALPWKIQYPQQGMPERLQHLTPQAAQQQQQRLPVVPVRCHERVEPQMIIPFRPRVQQSYHPQAQQVPRLPPESNILPRARRAAQLMQQKASQQEAGRQCRLQEQQQQQECARQMQHRAAQQEAERQQQLEKQCQFMRQQQKLLQMLWETSRRMEERNAAIRNGLQRLAQRHIEAERLFELQKLSGMLEQQKKAKLLQQAIQMTQQQAATQQETMRSQQQPLFKRQFATTENQHPLLFPLQWQYQQQALPNAPNEPHVIQNLQQPTLMRQEPPFLMMSANEAQGMPGSSLRSLPTNDRRLLDWDVGKSQWMPLCGPIIIEQDPLRVDIKLINETLSNVQGRFLILPVSY